MTQQAPLRPYGPAPPGSGGGIPAVILAAGRGSRIAPGNGGRPKPLTRLLGLTLLERAVLSCREAGVAECIVVVGYAKEQVTEHLQGFAQKHGVRVRVVENPWWEEGNGTSVLAAEPFVSGVDAFLLVMADHIFDPTILGTLLEGDREPGTSTLAVDRRLDDIFDLDDATKVELRGRGIVAIGKEIGCCDAVDTGIFLCQPPLFQALREARNRGDGSLSAGMRRLIARGKARAVDIGDRFWIDVDTPESLAQARRLLLTGLPKGQSDGPVSRRLNRPLSRRLSALLATTPLTPNAISIVSFLLSLAAASLFGVGGYVWSLVAGLLVQAASVVDGSDGEIARLKFRTSRFGAWFDTTLDRYADVAIVAGITYGYWQGHPSPAVWLGGLFAVGGFIMYSYVRKEYQLAYGRRLPETRPYVLIPASRDVRLFIVFLGAMVGLAFAAVFVAGLLAHMAVVTRLLAVSRKREGEDQRQHSVDDPSLVAPQLDLEAEHSALSHVEAVE